MLRAGFVPLVAVALSGSIVSAAPTPQAAVTPQQPTVSSQAFRVDLATGALISLESTKSKKESQYRGKEYCYIEGARSPVTIRRDEPLVFAGRSEGSPKDFETWRKFGLDERTKQRDVFRAGMYRLEFLFVSAEGKRYATGKYVPMDGEPYGEVVTGVNPKRRNLVGQAFVFKPLAQLAPGEYVVTFAGMFTAGFCGSVVSAFRIVEAPVGTQTAPATPLPTAAPKQTTAQLTIDQVIQMVTAKLPDDIIITTIRNSGSKFDLNPDALIKLKTAGVSDTVLRAMMK
jgi:hypothetical protein